MEWTYNRMSRRLLNMLEYDAMKVCEKYGIPIPRQVTAKSPQEAEQMAAKLVEDCGGNIDLVIKAQVLTGGRGKGHFEKSKSPGVVIVNNLGDVKKTAQHMLGDRLITNQTGSDGIICDKVLIAERLFLRNERYVSLTLDRKSGGIVMIVTTAGGSNVEEMAEAAPGNVIKISLPPNRELASICSHEMAESLKFSSNLTPKVANILTKLYNLFINTDATLVEINPLAEVHDGRIIACDSKITLDDNADFRQDEYFKNAPMPVNPAELAAKNAGVNYISLDGNVACIVNGAGLAMATMDLITLNGGRPANFLDVGGNADDGMLTSAVKIVANDSKAKVIFINIVGGIVRCDNFVLSLVEAIKHTDCKLPLVVRLKGTNANEALDILKTSGINCTMCDDFDKAAKTAVELAK